MQTIRPLISLLVAILLVAIQTVMGQIALGQGNFIQGAANTANSPTLSALEEFYAPHGGRANFPNHYTDAIEAFLYAEDELENNDFAAASARVEAIFEQTPMSSPKWYEDATIFDLNVGVPIAYYGLRMLDQILKIGPVQTKETLHMTAVVPTCATVTRPTLPDLTPETVDLAIDSEILANNAQVLHQATRLFRHWVKAITGGSFVELTIVPLNECAIVGFNVSGNAIFSYPNATELADSAPIEIRKRTDIWWVVAPSGVPGDGSDFEQVFVTGGMGLSSAGAPLFISDDGWFVRKPAHLGVGPYTEVERRLYMPQWFQHEFMHHLFRTWPEFELENVLHQWFQRETWPEDFVGQNESDYFAEAIAKRLLTATPSLAEGLNRPQTADFRSFQLTRVTGKYERKPVENGFHSIEVTVDAGGSVTWSNESQISWALDVVDGELFTEVSSPYGVQPVFAELDMANRVVALIFLGERYSRIDLEDDEACFVVKAANDAVINFCL